MTRCVPPEQLELVPARCQLRAGMTVRIRDTRLVFVVAEVRDFGETVVADRDFFPVAGSHGREYWASAVELVAPNRTTG